MARKARVYSSTGDYHVVIRGMKDVGVFAEQTAREKFLEILDHYKEECGYEIYGYCILDDHLHIVLKEGSVKLSGIMKRISVKFIVWYNREYGHKGKVFYDRFKSEVIESDEYLLEVLRFIYQEPVRRGLVMEVARYGDSSYGIYQTGMTGLVDCKRALSQFGMSLTRFNKFMNEPSHANCMDAAKEVVEDRAVEQTMLKLAGIKKIVELHEIPKERRNAVLLEVKSLYGISAWQVARVSGFSQGLVANLGR